MHNLVNNSNYANNIVTSLTLNLYRVLQYQMLKAFITSEKSSFKGYRNRVGKID